ncbi:FtsX-like permease family protein [Gordonia sp. HY002]|uniref:ABC transporter permease n=1 Tax=Gordonia zhenghanii TaxID=2911516 RepID=UPI001EF041DF|nr:FtsX-like permease family protein [Gordonia zhenghanii]MCF8570884.1 FtsX-like permease family protein [Gordonia zhenghanii]MCF8608393.1 FtsX-like permease family protein [Gordonia zhenghanii]
MRATSSRLTVGSLRELSSIGVVCGLSAMYATTLICASSILETTATTEGGGAGMLLDIVAGVFIMIALFVSGVVISNGVDTVIAGRRKELGLLRLVGASSRQLRDSLVTAVAKVAVVGSVAGVVVGVASSWILRVILVGRGTLPRGHYDVLPPLVLVGALAVVGTAVGATFIGSRSALATASAVHSDRVVRSWLRDCVAVVVLAGGALLLVAACYLGENASTSGFVVAFFGSAIVGVGVMLGAGRIVPGLVSVAGRLAGSSPSAVIARKNAVSDPQRTTRSTIGLLIGVTLVTTIAGGMQALTESVHSWEGMSADEVRQTEQTLSVTSSVLIAMIAISAVIAAVGFVSTMSLTVIGRTREIGMLRAMGFTAKQIRSMITLESVALSGTAVVFGLVLGILFGSVGAQSLIGAMTDGFVIGLPLPALVAIVACTVALVVAASLPPSRRAVAVTPVDALAVA